MLRCVRVECYDRAAPTEPPFYGRLCLAGTHRELEAARRDLQDAGGLRVSYGQFDAKAGYEPNTPHMMDALIVEGDDELPVLYRNAWNAVRFDQNLVIRCGPKETGNGHGGHSPPTSFITWIPDDEAFTAPGEERFRLEGVKKILEERIGVDPGLRRRIASIQMEHDGAEWRLRTAGKIPSTPFAAAEESRRTMDAISDGLGMRSMELMGNV